MFKNGRINSLRLDKLFLANIKSKSQKEKFDKFTFIYFLNLFLIIADIYEFQV